MVFIDLKVRFKKRLQKNIENIVMIIKKHLNNPIGQAYTILWQHQYKAIGRLPLKKPPLRPEWRDPSAWAVCDPAAEAVTGLTTLYFGSHCSVRAVREAWSDQAQTFLWLSRTYSRMLKQTLDDFT